jgi:hypothetical protein
MKARSIASTAGSRYVVRAASLHVPCGLSAGPGARGGHAPLNALRTFIRGGWRWAAAACFCAWTLTTFAQPLTGGSYVLVGAVAAGAGAATGGAYSLSAWVPTEGAGRSAGGDLDLTAGLLGLYGAADDTVWLNVGLTLSGNVHLWWSAESTGYQLEFTPALGPTAAWQPVVPAPAGNSYTVEPAAPARFFRLRKP